MDGPSVTTPGTSPAGQADRPGSVHAELPPRDRYERAVGEALGEVTGGPGVAPAPSEEVGERRPQPRPSCGDLADLGAGVDAVPGLGELREHRLDVTAQ